ncbi:MAG TPA: YibE/F family protein, partial [Pirellulaceae bacterium]|nr:YibE/F family protein [Pirellulaceae bacterium]
SLGRLYWRAIDVGRDHVSATVNTLVLAYVGSSLPVLLMLIVVGLVGRRIARPDRPFPFQSRRAGLLLVTASIVLLVLVGPSLPALAVLAFGTLRAIRPVRAKTVSAPAIA